MAVGNVVETIIGAVVLSAAGGFLVYAANTADIGFGGAGGSYPVVAEFRKAEGLSVGGDVRISGVKVGSVSEMALNPQNYFARITLAIEPGVELPEDSLAKITSDGLLGSAYVAVEPGASDLMFEPGMEFEHTQGSVNITELVGRAVQGFTGE